MQGSLDPSACKEWFSVAYVEALAYTAGFAVQPMRVDHFGVDLEIRDRALRIDVQMKCTGIATTTRTLGRRVERLLDLLDHGTVTPVTAVSTLN